MTEPLVFLNGKMVPASQANLKIYDLGIVLGATVTEMTRTFRQQPFRLDDHVDRSVPVAQVHAAGYRHDARRFLKATRQLIEHNAPLIPDDDELGLIHFVTPGETPIYAGSAAGGARTTPTVCIHTFPMPFELWATEDGHRGARRHAVDPPRAAAVLRSEDEVSQPDALLPGRQGSRSSSIRTRSPCCSISTAT